MKENLFIFVVGSMDDYSNVDDIITDVISSDLPPAVGHYGESIRHSSKGNCQEVAFHLPENISKNLAYVFAWGLVSEYWGPDHTISQLFTMESWNAKLGELGIE